MVVVIMNREAVYEKLEKLSAGDLISFRAHLHTGNVPMHVWESRIEVVGDINQVIDSIAGEKGYDIPSSRELMGTENFSNITPEQNLQNNLGVSWSGLEDSYFVN